VSNKNTALLIMGMEQTECDGFVREVRSRPETWANEKFGYIFLSTPLVRRLLFVVLFLSLFSVTVHLRIEVERREIGQSPSTEKLRLLPKGEILKPMLLGYEQLGADLVWMEFVQVLGADDVAPQDYEWMRHALDVVTTLDPQFVPAYDLGGVILAEVARRVDWSNALLEKGMTANPQAWRLPFLLGFNHFFHLQDYSRAAGYLAKAARLPGSPPYVPELAARLYAQANTPEIALRFLETIRRETQDSATLAALDRRRSEVLIERDITLIEKSIASHLARYGSLPSSLEQLVERGFLRSLPVEPFGGAYQFDPRSGQVISTTHPQRLRVFRPDGTQQVASWSSLP
jgi:hypothetical protein